MTGRPLSAEEVARDVLNVGRSTVTRLVRDEGLPHYVLAVGPKGRKLIRFDRQEVEDWIASRRERRLTDWSIGQRKGRG